MSLDPVTAFTSQQLAVRYASHGMTPRLARRLLASAVRFGIWPDQDTTISVRWLSGMRNRLHIPSLSVLERRKSAVDGFEKFLFAAPDGARFESVLIPLAHRQDDRKAVVCVSSQAGCALGCAFCATGRLGFSRHLEVWEIVAQVAQLRRESTLPVRGVVFMGMGEPLLNVDAVLQAAEIFSEPCGLAISAKAITLSTVGIVPAILRLARERQPYRLIVSLTSADPDKRRRVMPVDAQYPLDTLRDALAVYHAATGRRVTLAWTLIAGFNTSEEDARRLAAWVGELPVQLDLIDVNDATGRFVPPDDTERNAFRDALRRHLAAPVVRRYSGGKDIQAACGMLAAQAAAASAKAP
ncbi:MAG: radical SAM protein [Kiritimatiellia bacterium]|jgi:23S rRNA (adenine2503-C2)-methyltransferase|nr:radical SAM protein [Kiritimatiellia bacterium]MDD4172801.1 radical SAM protein [Kiritimatiellia bacterium]MDD4442090.1 radical SAM protein [Kiritimatiellia bacterium]NLC82083.1 radical SAM protein [Lentisphaerota bacterium]